MSEPNDKSSGESAGSENPKSGTATTLAPKKVPARKPPQTMPPYKVLLHNDDVNEADRVVRCVVRLTPLNTEEAVARMLEAHKTGVALLLVTHKERAELFQEQFASAGLTVTIEPDA